MTAEKSADWLATGLDHVWLPYAQMKTAPVPLPVVETFGTRIKLADGRDLIDGIASWWTTCHGYNHPHIRSAVERQLKQMPHVMFGGLVHEQPLRLARRLSELLPGYLDRVFFSESGSVAVEVAMKMAVQYWLNRGERRRTKFVAFKGAYHGDTTGTMALCDPETGMHELFAGLLPQHHIADLPRDDESAARLDALILRESENLAGLIVEPLVQGAGGMLFHDAAVRRLTHRSIFSNGKRGSTRWLRLRASSLELCRSLRGVKDVRVKGAIGVVEMDKIEDHGAMRAQFIERGVFVRPLENVIYLTPAIIISEANLSRLTEAIVDVVRGCRR